LLNRGRGVDANPEMAFEWFSKAAEQGHPKAQHAVGTYLEEGKGTKSDYGAAAEWYRRAGAQGDAKAERNLGVLYYQ
tara:strand:- start:1193 stop:1423 length:231 start_codon:yes stop_codon:yes gene_type:complete